MSNPIQGRPPSAEQESVAKAAAEAWRKVINESPVQALARAEESAKQLIALTGTLQGLYFAVFALSDLRTRVTNPLLQLIFLIPLALWLISLFCATRVFIPQPYQGADLADDRINAWQQVRETYFAVGAQKLAWLQRAHLLLVISFATVLVLIISLAFLPDAPATAPTQIIILTPTPTP